MTSRMRRQIQANNEIANSSISIVDELTKAKTWFTISCKGDDPKMQFRELMNKHRTGIVNVVNETFEIKKSMQFYFEWT